MFRNTFKTFSLLAGLGGFLVLFGSLVGFTAYIFLLNTTTPARASTYAYVNPIVAVILGWLLAGEPVSTRTALAAAVPVNSTRIPRSSSRLANSFAAGKVVPVSSRICVTDTIGRS